jgi:hypothetical protein
MILGYSPPLIKVSYQSIVITHDFSQRDATDRWFEAITLERIGSTIVILDFHNPSLGIKSHYLGGGTAITFEVE